MTLTDLIFPIATVVLAVACYACYKTNKPLREKARGEKRQAAEKAAREAREAHDKLLRDELRVKVYSDIEQALRDPDYTLTDHRYGSGSRGKYRWDALAKLAHLLKGHTDTAQEVRNLNERVYAQAKTIRDLKGQIKDIHAALQLGQPVE